MVYASESTRYIAASVNRFARIADISPSGSIIVFGSSHLLALWNPKDPADLGITQILHEHRAVVTCVQFLSEDSFFSADERGDLLLWANTGAEWKLIVSTHAHESSICSLTTCSASSVVVTGSSDAQVKLWSQLETNGGCNDLKLLQALDLKGNYPLDLKIAPFPGYPALLLCVATTDSSIHVWTSLSPDGPFLPKLVLSGHGDWVKCLAITNDQSTLTLASGCQDGTIRLWKIEPYSTHDHHRSGNQASFIREDLLGAVEESWNEGVNADGGQISSKRHFIQLSPHHPASTLFSVTFDALLVGHEEGITSLAWRPYIISREPTLLSTSHDSSVILWSPSSSKQSSLWVNSQRFGDVGGQRLGGFMGGLWEPQGLEVYAWSWRGGFRKWECQDRSDSQLACARENWRESTAITGHQGAVKSICWSMRGDFLLSCGMDQTTRIHAAYSVTSGQPPTWHEIARPQVHGYDMSGVASFDSLKFASSGDEKVLRVFDAPHSFVHLLKALSIRPGEGSHSEVARPLAANVPPLGLSNKAIADTMQSSGAPTQTRRPFEAELASVTLWPEEEKVFGHGYELITIAASPSGLYIATACKATDPEHAVIRVFETKNWTPFGPPLMGHALTITSIAFSPDENLILSVSRDRTWRLFEKNGSGYQSLATCKAHARIIWDCAWAASGDVFVTAGRDKNVKMWGKGESNTSWVCVHTLQMPQAATAVDFAAPQASQSLLAVGQESGEITIYSGQGLYFWTTLQIVCSRLIHGGLVQRVTWRPSTGQDGVVELASCSEDGTLRITEIRVNF